MHSLASLKKEFEEALKGVSSTKDLEEVRLAFLGRKGKLQELMQSLRDVSPEERPKVGKEVNLLKEEVTARLQDLEHSFLSKEEEGRLRREALDITLPGRKSSLGRKHPISAMIDEMLDVHMEMGFSVQYGPEIETDYYNFEALNFEEDHPAREMHDTYYIQPEVLLRTHTSNTQVRVMEKNRPPIRIATPGRCFRNEDITARSHVFFHQVEGLYIDEGVTFADLMQTLNDLVARLFHREVQLRCRPSYFPFVEPGLEVDIDCSVCHGKGCAICKGTGWLEILGAGMVHPEVLKSGGIDPEKYTGFAWGMGVERLAMLRHGIEDIRLFAENDQRFLRQFSYV